jgi:hypothetical protein
MWVNRASWDLYRSLPCVRLLFQSILQRDAVGSFGCLIDPGASASSTELPLAPARLDGASHPAGRLEVAARKRGCTRRPRRKVTGKSSVTATSPRWCDDLFGSDKSQVRSFFLLNISVFNQTVTTILPNCWFDSTYRCASTICSSENVLAMIGLRLPSASPSLMNRFPRSNRAGSVVKRQRAEAGGSGRFGGVVKSSSRCCSWA